MGELQISMGALQNRNRDLLVLNEPLAFLSGICLALNRAHILIYVR
jgi:hypothetical protein